MTRFTPGTRFCFGTHPLRGLTAGGLVDFHMDMFHPGQGLQHPLASSLIWRAASGFAVVNCMDTLTAPLAAEFP